MEEVDRLIIHALEQIGVSRLSSPSSDVATTLRDFSVEDVVEGVSRCLMAIDPSLDLPLKVPPAMAARYRIGTDLAAAVRSVGFSREIGYQTFLYLNENDLRDLFVFLVEALPKEKMDEGADEEPEATQGNASAQAAALMMRRKCVEAIAAELRAAGIGGTAKGVGRGRAAADDYSAFVHMPRYEDFETIRLKIPRYDQRISSSAAEAACGEYDDELVPWVWDQTAKNSIAMASLMEANTRAIIGSGERKASASEEYDVGMMLKRSIASAKSSLAQDEYFSALSPTKLTTEKGLKPTKPLKPSKLTKPVLKDESVRAELDPNCPVAEENSSVSLSMDETSAMESAAEERQSALARLESECEAMRGSLETLKEEILGLHDVKSQNEEKIEELSRTQREVEAKAEHWDKLSLLLPDAEENAKKLEMRLAHSQQKMVKLQEEWNAVRLPLEQEIQAASTQADVKAGILAGLAEELKAATAKCDKLKEDLVEKEARLGAVSKQIDAAFPKGEEEKNKAVSRNSFTKRILEIVNNIKKQKAELDRIIEDTKEISKSVNTLEGKLERSFALADELVFKDAKKDEAVRRAYKLLAALHETCGSLIGVVDGIGTTVRGCRDKEDELEKEKQLEMEANLEKITADLESMKRENASLMKQ